MKVCRSQVDACEREWVDPYLVLPCIFVPSQVQATCPSST